MNNVEGKIEDRDPNSMPTMFQGSPENLMGRNVKESSIFFERLLSHSVKRLTDESDHSVKRLIGESATRRNGVSKLRMYFELYILNEHFNLPNH